MPGLISSNVGFSNVIFIQLSHNLDQVSNCTVRISMNTLILEREREECVAVLIGTHILVHYVFFYCYSVC